MSLKTRINTGFLSKFPLFKLYNVTLNVWADNKDAVHFYEKIGMHIQKIGMEKILHSADDV